MGERVQKWFKTSQKPKNIVSSQIWNLALELRKVRKKFQRVSKMVNVLKNGPNYPKNWKFRCVWNSLLFYTKFGALIMKNTEENSKATKMMNMCLNVSQRVTQKVRVAGIVKMFAFRLDVTVQVLGISEYLKTCEVPARRGRI